MKQYLCAARRDPLWVLMWVGGFWLFGVILVLAINATVNDEQNYACMGTLFGLAGVLPGVLLRGNTSGHIRFRLAVTMGQTRKSFLLWDTVITLLVAVIGIFTAWVLWHGESYLYRLLYPAYTNDIPLEVVFRWQIMAVVLLALPMVTLFFTGITQRFGTKGFGVLWLLLWGGCMLIPAPVGSAADGGTSLLARMGGGVLWLAGILPPLAWACMGAAVLIAAAVAGILCLCTAEVKL